MKKLALLSAISLAISGGWKIQSMAPHFRPLTWPTPMAPMPLITTRLQWLSMRMVHPLKPH